jgi:hypothetical protein
MIDITATPDGEEYKNCRIIIIPQDGAFYTVIEEPNGLQRHKFMSENASYAAKRAREVIDFQINSGIISTMKVTNEHTLQLGDIVAIRNGSKKTAQLGIVDAVRADGYWVSHIKQVNKFYKRVTSEVCYPNEKLSHYPNREKWIQIKSDLERQGDGEILEEWLNNL